MVKEISVKFPDGEYKQINPELLVEVDFEGQHLYVLEGSGYIVALRRTNDGGFVKVPLEDQNAYNRLNAAVYSMLLNARKEGRDIRECLLPFDILPSVISEQQFANPDPLMQLDYATIFKTPNMVIQDKNPRMDYTILVPILITDFGHSMERHAFHTRGSKIEALGTQWEHFYEQEEGLPLEVISAMNRGRPNETIDVSVDGRINPYVRCVDRMTNQVVTRQLFPGIIDFHIHFYPSFSRELIECVNESDRISILEEDTPGYNRNLERAFSRGMLEHLPVITESRTFGFTEYGSRVK